MQELTEDEVNSKYGEVKLTFSSYYKYSFTFIGVAEDGARIVAGWGSDSDDIYKYNLSNNEQKKLGKVSTDWHHVSVTMGEDILFSYFDY